MRGNQSSLRKWLTHTPLSLRPTYRGHLRFRNRNESLPKRRKTIVSSATSSHVDGETEACVGMRPTP